MEESRKQFEAWWYSAERGLTIINFGVQRELQWAAWRASRQAVELALPTQVEYDDPLSAHRAINDCADIIRAAGLRIKGE